MMINLDEKEKSEIEFYRDSKDESPNVDSLGNLLNKMTDCSVFVEAIKPFDEIFRNSKKVLEIGGGQGWASAALKKIYPNLTITLTDISKYAVESKGIWEKIFNSKIENAYDCRSYDTKELDNSIDLVFCYASAHHFVKQRKTLKEIYRILKNNGKCIYFHEPSSSRLLYSLAHKRVNMTRTVVPEDVLKYDQIKKMAFDIGFSCDLYFDTSLIKRKPLETLYYFILGKIPLLKKMLPCTINYLFTKE